VARGGRRNARLIKFEDGARYVAPGQCAKAGMSGNRVLLTTLSARTSAKGRPYLSGWLGKASVVAFEGEPDKRGLAGSSLVPGDRAWNGRRRGQARREQPHRILHAAGSGVPTSLSCHRGKPAADGTNGAGLHDNKGKGS
jgi:hypothetical protein